MTSIHNIRLRTPPHWESPFPTGNKETHSIPSLPAHEQTRMEPPPQQAVRLDLTCLLNGFYQLHQNRGSRVRWGELLCQLCQYVAWKEGTG